jgi:hypothetical protein
MTSRPSGKLAHPRPNLDRFVTEYRKAGGRVALDLYEGEGQAFITRNSSSPNASKAIDKIIEFAWELTAIK